MVQGNNYSRWLDLLDDVAYTAFTKGGIDYQREYYTSRDKDVMIIHLTASRRRSLFFTASLSRPQQGTVSLVPGRGKEAGTLLLEGALDSGKPGQDGMKYRVAMRVVSKGGKQFISAEDGIMLTGTTSSEANFFLTGILKFKVRSANI